MEKDKKSIGADGKYTKNGVPNGYTTITPFITIKEPEKAIEFYQAVFLARVKNITEYADEEGNKKVAHAELDFGNGCLQLGAANQAYHLVLPPKDGNACYSFAIYVSDVDVVYERALARGATVRESLVNFASGDRFVSILDPYGVRWSIMTRIEDLSEEESNLRVEKWAKSFLV